MIHHVTLECQRADAAAHRDFWTALGFAPVTPPPSLADRADWYERGGTQIHLLWTDEPRLAGHVAIVVDDLDALGFEARTAHWGERRGYMTAPGGHTVEVFERGPS